MARNRAALKHEGAQQLVRDFDEIRGAVERYCGYPIQGKKILELGAATVGNGCRGLLRDARSA